MKAGVVGSSIIGALDVFATNTWQFIPVVVCSPARRAQTAFFFSR
jgi:hypothetical protein